jgi:hypothetical protein
MSTIVRNYKMKDVDMLLASSIIVEAALAHKVFLQSKRANWGGTFFEDLQAEVNQVIQDVLGIDNAKALRLASQENTKFRKIIKSLLAEVKVQIEQDFKHNPVLKNEILQQLGFASYYKGVLKNNQEALINLLFQFQNNLTETLKTTIVNLGTPIDSLEQMVSYAMIYKNIEVKQETEKGVRGVNSHQKVVAFNIIYDKVIGLSQIARTLFKNNPEIQSQFSFNKTTKKLHSSTKSQPELKEFEISIQ